MESLLGLLPLLLFLACPVLMVACFVGMRRMGHSSEPAPAAALADLTSAEQVAALHVQLQQLQQQQAVIARQLDELARALPTDPASTLEAAPDPAMAEAHG